MESTTRLEAEVARRHTPDIAWPTIILLVGCLGLWGLSSALALMDIIPLWLAMVPNTLALYAIYTPVHDASHSAVVPRNKQLRWVNTLVGTLAAFPIFMTFHIHRKSHFIHHARTNGPENPDTFLMGSFWSVVLVKTPLALINQLNSVKVWQDCARLKLTRSERLQTLFAHGITIAILLGLVVAGMGWELLCLWLIPWFVGEHVMEVTFGWFPHHDHTQTGRYADTRISLFPCADLLYLQQNLHLIHHMLPVVPFYRYRAVFDELRPTLVKHGARIEGFWPGSRPTGH